MNLYEELVDVLAEHGKKINDVLAVQGDDFRVSLSEFLKIASNTEDTQNGWCIAEDLVLLGDGFVICRWSYDGREGFKFVDIRIKENIRPITSVEINSAGRAWTLAKIQDLEINKQKERK